MRSPNPHVAGEAGDSSPAIVMPKFEAMRPRKGVSRFRMTTKYVHQRSEGLRGKRGTNER